MKRFLLATGFAVALVSCDQGFNFLNDNSVFSAAQLDVAQISAQLASGATFSINGSSTDSLGGARPPRHGHHGPKDHHAPLDGVSLLPPTDELLAITDAESAGDFRGLRMFIHGGALVTHFDINGASVTLPLPERTGPQGCSVSGGQFPAYDSLLSAIARTEINFGSGVTYRRDSISITRTGKIIITRTGNGSSLSETIRFDGYSVNGNTITGTKTRVSTFNEATSSGASRTLVGNGSITFKDGTTAAWTTERSRMSSLTLDDNGRPASGTITTQVNTTVSADGSVIYSHKTTSPLVEDINCRRHAPGSGTVQTVYGGDTIVVNFGDGSCDSRTIIVTVNGVTETKTIGG